MFLQISEEEYRACAKLYLKDYSDNSAKSNWVRGDPNTDTKRLAVLSHPHCAHRRGGIPEISSVLGIPEKLFADLWPFSKLNL